MTREVVLPADETAVAKQFNLNTMRVLWDQYLEHKKRVAESTAWIEEFQKTLGFLSEGASEFTLDGAVVLTARQNGNFAPRRFGSEQPQLAERYTEIVAKKQLNTERLKAEHPEVFEAYRAKVFRIEANPQPSLVR